MRTSTEKALDQIRARVERRAPTVCQECGDREEVRLVEDILEILDSLTP